MSLAELVVVSVKVEGRSKSEVARDYKISRYWVQQLVKRYELEGEAAFTPRSRRSRRGGNGGLGWGRAMVRETVCRVAKTPPQERGRPFTTWSLSKLVEYLAMHKRIRISAKSTRPRLWPHGSWGRTMV